MPQKSITFKRARTPHYDDPAAVGKRIFDAREAAGLSQRELAFPGCSAAYISRIERGERVPSLQVLREIARRTGVSEEALAYGRETLDVAVAERIRDAEAAEATGHRHRPRQRLQGSRARRLEGRARGGGLTPIL